MDAEQKTRTPRWTQIFTWPKEYGSDEELNGFGYFGLALVAGALFTATTAQTTHQLWWFVATLACVVAYLGTGLAFYLFELALFREDD